MEFEYYINLNERGLFYADVRDAQGVTVFEIHEEEMEHLVEDGFMRHYNDVEGLTEHLTNFGIIPEGSEIIRTEGDRGMRL